MSHTAQTVPCIWFSRCGYSIRLLAETDPVSMHDIEILDRSGNVKQRFALPANASSSILANAPCGINEDWVWAGAHEKGFACKIVAWYMNNTVGISHGPPA